MYSPESHEESKNPSLIIDDSVSPPKIQNIESPVHNSSTEHKATMNNSKNVFAIRTCETPSVKGIDPSSYNTEPLPKKQKQQFLNFNTSRQEYI